MRNRSVPVDAVLPHVSYQNLTGALDWLTRTFGFTEHYHYGERQYGVVDPDGHHRLFSQHPHDLSPDEWGAVIVRR